MFRLKVEILMREFGVKQEAIILLINSNRNSFAKKMKDNSFTDAEMEIIISRYGKLL